MPAESEDRHVALHREVGVGVAVVVMVLVKVIPLDPIVADAVMPPTVAVQPEAVIAMCERASAPVIDFTEMSVPSMFFMDAMVLVLVMIMTIDVWSRRIPWRVMMTLVVALVAVSRFAGVAVRLCAAAEGKTGNA